MLILADADSHGLNLDKLGKGILQAAGDRDGRTQIHVVIGEFLRCQRRGGINGGTGFIDHGISLAAVDAPKHFGSHLLCLTRGRAVADGKMLNMMLFNQSCQFGDGLFFFCIAEGGIHHGGI